MLEPSAAPQDPAGFRTQRRAFRKGKGQSHGGGESEPGPEGFKPRAGAGGGKEGANPWVAVIAGTSSAVAPPLAVSGSWPAVAGPWPGKACSFRAGPRGSREF